MVKTSRCWVLILGRLGDWHNYYSTWDTSGQLGSMSPLLSARNVVELQLAGAYYAHELLRCAYCELSLQLYLTLPNLNSSCHVWLVAGTLVLGGDPEAKVTPVGVPTMTGATRMGTLSDPDFKRHSAGSRDGHCYLVSSCASAAHRK